MSSYAVMSVKTDNGLVVGETTHVDHNRLLVDIVATLRPGQVLEFRLELPGADDTIQGLLRVDRCEKDKLRAEIVEIAEADRAVFEAWWAEREKGHVVYHPRVALMGETAGRSEMHGASDAETDFALAGMEARRARMRARFDEESWRDEDTADIFVHGLFDQALAPTSVGAAPPPPSSRPRSRTRPRHTPPPVRRVPAASIPAAQPPVAEPAPDLRPAPPRRVPGQPVVRLAGQTDDAMMSVHWPDHQAFLDSLIKGLASGFLTLPRGSRDHWPGHVLVHLHSPGGQELVVEGQHLTDEADSVLYKLDLEPAELDQLQAEAMGG